MTRFRFTPYHHPSLAVIRYPLIPVRLLGPACSVRQAMLLDSGADISFRESADAIIFTPSPSSSC